MNRNNFRKQYAHLIAYTNFHLAESIGERIAEDDGEDLQRKADDSAFGYEFGQLFPDGEKPFGVVIKTNPLTILSFDEKRYRIDELVNRFEYDEKKKQWGWYENQITWCVPNKEDMRLILDNSEVINRSIASASEPYCDGFEWDEDEEAYRPLFRTENEPNPFKRDRIKDYCTYMTRDQYNETYWSTVSKRGTDYCSWTESENIPTRIIGIVGENVLRR